MVICCIVDVFYLLCYKQFMKDFKERKASGKIETQVVLDEELHVRTKQYDPATGEEVDSRKDVFLRTSLEQNKAELEAQISDIEAMLSEFKNK